VNPSRDLSLERWKPPRPLFFVVDSGFYHAQTGVVKARLGILMVFVCLCSGCVAIPPLINVQHSEPKEGSTLKGRVDELERRVRELEAKQERR
jgi:hypothetical protein